MRARPFCSVRPPAGLPRSEHLFDRHGPALHVGQLAPLDTGQIGPLTQKLYDTLTGIQWGKLPDVKGWTVPVKQMF